MSDDNIHPSSLTDVVTLLEADRDEARAEVERLRAKVSDMRSERLRLEAEVKRLLEVL